MRKAGIVDQMGMRTEHLENAVGLRGAGVSMWNSMWNDFAVQASL
jgi:hypothetical protein